jgi:hypothetical protein
MRLFLTSILRVGVLESRFGEEIHTQKVFHNHIFCIYCPLVLVELLIPSLERIGTNLVLAVWMPTAWL